MTITREATYDGEVLRFDKPIELEPNTRVRVTIEAASLGAKKNRSFLQTGQIVESAGAVKLSSKFEDYVYDQKRDLNEQLAA